MRQRENQKILRNENTVDSGYMGHTDFNVICVGVRIQEGEYLKWKIYVYKFKFDIQNDRYLIWCRNNIDMDNSFKILLLSIPIQLAHFHK